MTPGPGRPSAAARTLAFLFGGYVGFQFMMTHWPKLVVPGPGRPDLIVHIAVFGTWNALLIACGRFGPRLSTRNIALSTLTAAIYAAIDESLQLIPFIRRVAALDDYAANLSGILLVAFASLALRAILRRPGASHE
ncbi:MAG: hypothetical protein IT436_14870 [Phycisphaerales bacterium]|nr:hypothetical protein [Phycisphaerales bacterium]